MDCDRSRCLIVVIVCGPFVICAGELLTLLPHGLVVYYGVDGSIGRVNGKDIFALLTA